MQIERLEWIRVGEDLPDATVTVLLFNAEASEPVWPGYYDVDEDDNVTWYGADGFPIPAPTHWAEMPEGPDAMECGPELGDYEGRN